MLHCGPRAALIFTNCLAIAAAAPPDDLSGIWSSATATPLERPAQLKDKKFFTPAEAENWERQFAAARSDAAPDTPRRGVGTYNAAFLETVPKVVRTLRTSIITDPPEGRLPALTPGAAAEKNRRMELLRNPSHASDFGLQDRCIAFVTTGPPMLPYAYNSNYQFLVTDRQVLIHVEMIHDTRVIHLDRTTHAPPELRFWFGDSIGHWDGKTLVVDTTNFNDSGGFYGDAGGMFGWDRKLHVVERFSLLDPETLLYQFEIDDPTAFTRPWKGELTMTRSAGPIYEYGCHEGNYAMPNLLNGYRGRP